MAERRGSGRGAARGAESAARGAESTTAERERRRGGLERSGAFMERRKIGLGQARVRDSFFLFFSPRGDRYEPFLPIPPNWPNDLVPHLHSIFPSEK
jgi:hypothetical protein